MRTLRFSLALCLVPIGLSTAPAIATASPSFPGAIQTDLSLTYSLGTTHCIICHATNAGGIGTVVQPFGKAMRAAGLVLENTASLAMALQILDADKTDSDCDGTPDIEQLKMGRDPNPPGEYIDGSGKPTPPEPDAGCGADGGMVDIANPAYGCQAQLAAGPLSWSGAAGLATVLALGALATRRGGPSPARSGRRRRG